MQLLNQLIFRKGPQSTALGCAFFLLGFLLFAVIVGGYAIKWTIDQTGTTVVDSMKQGDLTAQQIIRVECYRDPPGTFNRLTDENLKDRYGDPILLDPALHGQLVEQMKTFAPGLPREARPLRSTSLIMVLVTADQQRHVLLLTKGILQNKVTEVRCDALLSGSSNRLLSKIYRSNSSDLIALLEKEFPWMTKMTTPVSSSENVQKP